MHLLFWQILSLLHSPQLSEPLHPSSAAPHSAFRSAHDFGVQPPGIGAHRPLWQFWFSPQLPQFRSPPHPSTAGPHSKPRFSHVLGLHDAAHLEFTQATPGSHAIWHDPQCAASVCTSTHWPSQHSSLPMQNSHALPDIVTVSESHPHAMMAAQNKQYLRLCFIRFGSSSVCYDTGDRVWMRCICGRGRCRPCGALVLLICLFEYVCQFGGERGARRCMRGVGQIRFADADQLHDGGIVLRHRFVKGIDIFLAVQ